MRRGRGLDGGSVETTDIGTAIGRGVDLARSYSETNVFRSAPARERVSVPAGSPLAARFKDRVRRILRRA